MLKKMHPQNAITLLFTFLYFACVSISVSILFQTAGLLTAKLQSLQVISCMQQQIPSHWLYRVSTTRENPGNLREFEVAPGNTGNVLGFS